MAKQTLPPSFERYANAVRDRALLAQLRCSSGYAPCAASRGPGPFVLPTDFILPRGEGGAAIQTWASALDGLTLLQAKHAPHLLWVFQDSVPAWTVLKIHRGNRSVTIVDPLRRPHSRLAKAITTWITEF